MASVLYDKNFHLLEKLYHKVKEIDMSRASDDQKLMNDQLFNYFAWGAANFQKKEFLSQLMFQASILNFKIDMQTYIKA